MPRTEAGKPVCVHGHAYGLHPADEQPDCETFAPVTEHKAEAVAAERERIRAAVVDVLAVNGWVVREIENGERVTDEAFAAAIVNPEAEK